MSGTLNAAQAHTANLLAVRAEACRRLSSPLYHHLLVHAAQDVRAGGPTWDVCTRSRPWIAGEADPLRLMAAVHRLVLLGRAPDLALFYPSVGGTLAGADALERVWRTFRALLAERGAEVRALMALPCQTNEVARAAALLGGFLLVARESGLPLRLLELGSSAGLQLRWDGFHYDTGGGAWGPPDSPVRLSGNWLVPPPHLDTAVEVVARSGCDLAPVDPTSAEGRLTLRASVWADQLDRFARLRGALRLAAEMPAPIDALGAVDWLPPQLAAPPPGVATVVFHSALRQYLRPGDLATLRAELTAAGRRATARSPLYWLSLEPQRTASVHRPQSFVVDLVTWPAREDRSAHPPGPGGRRRRLALSGPHGSGVRWLG